MSTTATSTFSSVEVKAAHRLDIFLSRLFGRKAPSHLDTVSELTKMARDCEDSMPNLASELRFLAARG